MKKDVLKIIKKIKIILTDVDGVLTDGGMYYTKNGDSMKKFHTRDGMGVTLLRKKDIPTMIVTKEKNDIIKQWAKTMNIKKLYDGVYDKVKILDIICNKFEVLPSEVAYIGDDINDIELLQHVGFSATPNDGINEIKKFCNYVCEKNGGNAAFREFADLILSYQNH